MTNKLKILTFKTIYSRLRKYSQQLRPDFAPCAALNEPARMMALVYIQTYLKQQSMLPSDTIGSHGKGCFMTFDREDYRAHIAPLNLPREQEDEMLNDLWSIAESLVDQSPLSPLYPLHLGMACEVFDAVEQAIDVDSKNKRQKEEAT